MKNGRQTLSAGLHNRPVCRATIPLGRKLFPLSAHLPTPRSTLVRVRGPFLLTGCASTGPSGSGRVRNSASGLSLHLPGLSRISLRRYVCQDPTQDYTKSLSFAASIIGARHAQQHEVFDGREVENIGSTAETKDGRSI